jgi:hypothetical protein
MHRGERVIWSPMTCKGQSGLSVSWNQLYETVLKRLRSGSVSSLEKDSAVRRANQPVCQIPAPPPFEGLVQ